MYPLPHRATGRSILRPDGSGFDLPRSGLWRLALALGVIVALAAAAELGERHGAGSGTHDDPAPDGTWSIRMQEGSTLPSSSQGDNGATPARA